MIIRMWRAYGVVRRVFGGWVSPLGTGVLFAVLRLVVWVGMSLDPLFFPKLRKTRLNRPIVIVGNPRTGTTFLQRFLSDNGVGGGSQLWQMVYPSLTAQKLLRPLLPLLERVSPARHHSTAAHATSLTSVETDDAALFLRFFDGFFLYGFILAWDDTDWQADFDPRNRDTSQRDFDFLEQLWLRVMVGNDSDRVIAKLFSVGTRMNDFLRRFPDARILYTVRDPVNVIPSAMSLVTGVLDKRFGFWSQPDELRARYLERLYQALIKLFQRFHEDYTEGRIPRESVYVVSFDRLMADFERLMGEILDFVGVEPDERLTAAIRERAARQRDFKSEHKYSLEKFGLDEDRIRRDCAFVYETFLNDPPGES